MNCINKLFSCRYIFYYIKKTVQNNVALVHKRNDNSVYNIVYILEEKGVIYIDLGYKKQRNSYFTISDIYCIEQNYYS